mgnify:CR=1 FL=1
MEKILGLLLVPIFTTYMKPEDFGIVSLMTLLVSIVSFVFMAGLPNAIMRLYFEYKNEDLNEVITGTLIYLLVVPLFMSLIFIKVGDQVFGLVLDTIPFYPLGFLSILTAYFYGIPQYLLALWRAQDKLKEYLIFSVVMSFFTTFLVIFFIVIKGWGGFGKILGGAIAGGIICVIGTAFLLKNFTPSFSLPKLKHSLAFGWPLVPHQLAVALLSLFDRYMLERFTDLSKVGIYSLGYSLGSIGLFVSAGFGQAWGPFFYSIAGNGDSPALFSRVTTYFFYFIGIVTLSLTLFAKEITALLASNLYQDANVVIPVVALGVFFYCLYTIPVYSLYFFKKTMLIPVVTGVAAAINIALNFFLIPAWGITGAAWATAISYAVMLLLVVAISQNLLRIPYEWPKMTIFTLVIILIVFLDFTIFGNSPVSFDIHSLLIKVAELLLSIACIFVCESLCRRRTAIVVS